MAFGFFRSVWISLRAANYTTQAFKDLNNNLTKAERKQLQFKMSSARNLMAVGMMYIAMGGIAVGVMNRLIMASHHGEKFMKKWGEKMEKSLGRIGRSLLKILAPILNVIAGFLEFASTVPVLRETIAILLVVGTTALFVFGTLNSLRGGLQMVSLLFDQITVKAIATAVAKGKYAVATTLAQIATMGLAKALIIATGGFTAAFAILTAINQPIISAIVMIGALTTALWALFIAESAASAGFALVAGGIAAGAALALATQMTGAMSPEYQMGTSAVKRTGFALVHKGEEIRSARETRIPSRFEEHFAGRIARKSTFYIPISIGTVQTKADKETLAPLLKRYLKEELDKKV